MSFKEHLLTEVTYDVYVESLNEGFSGTAYGALKGFVEDVKELALKLSSEFKVSIDLILLAFKNRDVFKLLQGVAFNIEALFKAIVALHASSNKHLIELFRDLATSGVFQRLRQGLLSADQVLNTYPSLKQVTGIALAGLLLFMWLNSTFIGNIDHDFDVTKIIQALRGQFTLADLFGDENGVEFISLFFTGFFFSISVPWLGTKMGNLAFALVYTGLKRNPIKTPEIKNFLQSLQHKLG